MTSNPFEEMFGKYIGTDNKIYHCTKCKYTLVKMALKTTLDEPRKALFCKNSKCIHFGLLTVVAIDRST